VDSERLARTLSDDHRRLDDRLGRLLAALFAGLADAASGAAAEFDEALRVHTGAEEEQLLEAPADGRLGPVEGEPDADRLFRELRLEHVQVRELSGMIRRLLEERGDVAGARGLAASLANRWDAHTTREERDLPRALAGRLDPGRLERVCEALLG
jgi:hypothetical protein